MLKKLSNKELVAAGHKFAANISADTPLIDMAKMVSELATQLDVALAAAAEAGKQRGAVMTNLADMEDKLRIKQNHIKLRDTYIEELEQRAEDAEAKLAELEKQDSIATLYKDDRGNLFIHRCSDLQHGLTKVFAHPAPAIDLNAVRAEGVMMLSQLMKENGHHHHAAGARAFATQLRAGNAGKDGV
ncbi:hypothetical protein [Pantoea dispersa]|uniref:hypothetical protein n=1 Tax=Pantoea dispersa TaxID=59814 RepID=UPI0024AED1A7|nr:hypothetical protein [Pantoea dispersa]MDI6637074.1 hypothetical protein [Pantoea dispersa]